MAISPKTFSRRTTTWADIPETYMHASSDDKPAPHRAATARGRQTPIHTPPKHREFSLRNVNEFSALAIADGVHHGSGSGSRLRGGGGGGGGGSGGGAQQRHHHWMLLGQALLRHAARPDPEGAAGALHTSAGPVHQAQVAERPPHHLVTARSKLVQSQRADARSSRHRIDSKKAAHK